MLKKYGIIALCLFIGTGEILSQPREQGVANAETLTGLMPQWQAVLSDQPASLSINVLYSDITKSVLKVELPGFWMTPVRETPAGIEYVISVDHGSALLDKGAPDLYKAAASLIIPDQDQMDIKVVSAEYIDLEDILIAPSKGNLKRSVVPSEVPYEYGPAYQKDAFFPGKLAELRHPYIVRDIRGQAAVMYPIQYNAARDILRVYSSITIEVYSKSPSGDNRLERDGEDEAVNVEFNRLYEKHFLNIGQYRSNLRYTPVEEEGNMLIISYGAFISELEALKNWKISRGIPTTIVDVAMIGGAAQIKAYVQNYYNTNGLTYLLLVGDNAQVPASSTAAGPSDNDYAYVVGNDHYPDLFVGRFSAETVAQVQTQVLRTINHERNADVSASHFGRAITIGSSMGPGDDGEMDWQHQRYIGNDLLGYNYTYRAELFDGSQGGSDADGNPTVSMTASEINTGTGFISYTGHGNTSTWGTTGFSSSSVNSYLSNTGKLPVVISVACLNGNFTNATCMAESWLRATYTNGQPKGAVGALMSTINQAWSPPMDGQDEMVDILVESYTGNIKRTFGGIAMNGCMKMNDSYGINGELETDTWTVFGDPSLLIRTKSPDPMNVIHSTYVPLGTQQLQVECDMEGALVVLTDDNQIMASQTVSNGTVLLQFPAVNQLDTMTITVTGNNTVSHQAPVYFSDASMAYVSSDALQLNIEEVAPGTENAEVIGVKVSTTGTTNPLNLNSFKINLNGTTDIGDLSLVEIYYTGLSSVFSTANLYGTGIPAENNFIISGNQVLEGGENYFWISTDIQPDAPIGNMIDAECIRVTVSGSQETPAVTAPAGNRLIDVMQYQSSTAFTASTAYLNAGTQNAGLVCLKVVMDGVPDPLTLQSLSFNLNGTSDLGDITNLDIFYTLNDSAFSTANLYASVSPANGLITVNTAKVLGHGMNYFWIAADISDSSSSGNRIDASCEGFVIGGTSYIPAVTSPEGYRIIEALYCTPQYYYGTGYGDYISQVNLASINKLTGASSYPYYNLYQNDTTTLYRGQTYTLTLAAGTYTSNPLAAWIDYDQDGDFEPWEKLGEIVIGAKPATGTITFTIPDSASHGIMRLRVREVFNNSNLDPCMTYYYGETEDYRVEVYPGGLWLGNSNEWNDPANWLNGQVPGPTTSVVIPTPAAGAQVPTVFSGSNPQCKDITIETGVNLVIPSGVTFTIHGGSSM